MQRLTAFCLDIDRPLHLQCFLPLEIQASQSYSPIEAVIKQNVLDIKQSPTYLKFDLICTQADPRVNVNKANFRFEYGVRDRVRERRFNSSLQTPHYHKTDPSHPMNYSLYLNTNMRSEDSGNVTGWNSQSNLKVPIEKSKATAEERNIFWLCWLKYVFTTIEGLTGLLLCRHRILSSIINPLYSYSSGIRYLHATRLTTVTHSSTQQGCSEGWQSRHHLTKYRGSCSAKLRNTPLIYSIEIHGWPFVLKLRRGVYRLESHKQDHLDRVYTHF